MWMSEVEMNVWMRGRSASLIASQQVRMSLSTQRASPQMTAPLTSLGDRLHRLEVARAGDREAGLDHVHAEPRQLLGDLQLLRLVQADARGLLAVPQGGVEEDDGDSQVPAALSLRPDLVCSLARGHTSPLL